jgi:hypothetical protein
MATDNRNNPTGKPQTDKQQPIKDLNDKNVSPSKGENVKGGAAKKGTIRDA